MNYSTVMLDALLDKITAWYAFCKLKIKPDKDDKFYPMGPGPKKDTEAF